MISIEKRTRKAVRWLSKLQFRAQFLFKKDVLTVSYIPPEGGFPNTHTPLHIEDVVFWGLAREFGSYLFLLASIIWSLISLFFCAEMFARSGAVLVVASIATSFFVYQRLMPRNRQSESLYHEGGRLARIRSFMRSAAFTVTVVGSIIWGYGDLVGKDWLVNESNWSLLFWASFAPVFIVWALISFVHTYFYGWACDKPSMGKAEVACWFEPK